MKSIMSALSIGAAYKLPYQHSFGDTAEGVLILMLNDTKRLKVLCQVMAFLRKLMMRPDESRANPPYTLPLPAPVGPSSAAVRMPSRPCFANPIRYRSDERMPEKREARKKQKSGAIRIRTSVLTFG